MSVAVDVACDEVPVLTRTPADIVLAVDHSFSMAYHTDSLTRTKYIIEEFTKLLDPSVHRVGAVVYDDRAEVVSLLSTDHNRVVRSIAELTARPNMAPTSLVDALDKVSYVFSGDRRPGVPAICIIFGDGEREGYDPVVNADALRRSGVELYAVGFPLLPDDEELLVRVVGGRSHYFGAAPPDETEAVIAGLSALRVPARIDGVALKVGQTDQVELVAGSSVPTAIETMRALQWAMGYVAPGNYRFRYGVRPLVTGLLPVSDHIRATYTACDGTEKQVEIPVPVIEVIGPTPTEESTPTREPSTRTAEPTAPASATVAPSPRSSTATASAEAPDARHPTIFMPLVLPRR